MGIVLLKSGTSLQTGMVGHPPPTREVGWALGERSCARTRECVTHTRQSGFEQSCYGTLVDHSIYIRSLLLSGVVEK